MLRLLMEAILMLIMLLLQLGHLLVRAVPWLVRALAFIALLVYRLTFLLCRLALDWLQPVGAAFGIDPSGTPWRMGLCVLVVTGSGCLTLWLMQWPITPLSVVLLGAYGAAVGGIWDQLGPPSGLSLGT
jgi:hypothetical protein